MKKNSNILRIAQTEARLGNKFADGAVGFKFIKVIYILVVLYSVMMSMVTMFGNMFAMMAYAAKTTEDMSYVYNRERMNFIMLIIAIVTTMVSAVLMKLKLAIPMGITGCTHAIIAFTVFYGHAKQNNFGETAGNGFWLPLGIPTIFLAFFALLIMLLYIVDKRKVNKVYDTITSKLYQKATDGGSKTVNPDEFEKILDEYNGGEIIVTDKPLKKSLKRKVQKQKAKQDNKQVEEVEKIEE